MTLHEFEKHNVRYIADRDQQQSSRPTARQVTDDEISVLRDDHPIVRVRYTGDFAVGRSVALRQVEGMERVVATRRKEADKAARKLRVDEELHAAKTRIDFTSASRVAQRKQARRSSGSRSS